MQSISTVFYVIIKEGICLKRHKSISYELVRSFTSLLLVVCLGNMSIQNAHRFG